jgi:hypothetical protein
MTLAYCVLLVIASAAGLVRRARGRIDAPRSTEESTAPSVSAFLSLACAATGAFGILIAVVSPGIGEAARAGLAAFGGVGVAMITRGEATPGRWRLEP